MKKNLLSLAVLTLVLAACGSKSSFEGDVKKMGNYRCKLQQLEAKDPSDEKAKKEIADLNKEIDEYTTKMKDKYKGKEDDKEMNEKADKIMEDIMSKCK